MTMPEPIGWISVRDRMPNSGAVIYFATSTWRTCGWWTTWTGWLNSRDEPMPEPTHWCGDVLPPRDLPKEPAQDHPGG